MSITPTFSLNRYFAAAFRINKLYVAFLCLCALSPKRRSIEAKVRLSPTRSALLLEQAAHCFLNSQPTALRKYAFHMILSGHRFSKAGQKRHALRAYKQAAQVMNRKTGEVLGLLRVGSGSLRIAVDFAGCRTT